VQRSNYWPVAWIEQQTISQTTNNSSQSHAVTQHQDNVKNDSAWDQVRWEANVNWEICPTPEVQVTVDPLTNHQSNNRKGCANW